MTENDRGPEPDETDKSDEIQDGVETDESSGSTASVTLAERLDDKQREVTDRDLHQVIGFIYESLGTWYELNADGKPPSVDVADLIITPRSTAHAGLDEPVGSSLLDGGDSLAVSRDNEDPSDNGERDGVFHASTALAQAAVGRTRADDESWDDVIQELDTNNRPALASALWVGLASEPEARYGSIGQWRRAVDTALRSDTATATFLDGDDGDRNRTPLLVGAVLAVLIAATGIYLAVGGDGDTTDETATATVDAESEPESPVVTDDLAEDGEDVEDGDNSGDDTAESDEATGDGTSEIDSDADGDGSPEHEGGNDACPLFGPLGPIVVDQISDRAIVVSWTPSTEAVNILLNGDFIDTIPPEAFRYVIEQLPLSEEPLLPDTEYVVGVEPQSGTASTACTTTRAEPLPENQPLIGVTVPTGLTVSDTTATSITVAWDPRPGAETHNLYLDGTYLQFGDVGGSSTFGDETEFTFLDLQPDTTYEIGIRRIEGPNQSGITTITAATDAG